MILLLRLLREKKPGDSFHTGKGFKAFESGHAILATCCVCAQGVFCAILLMLWLCRGANYAKKDRHLLLALTETLDEKTESQKRAEIKAHTILSVAAAWDSSCTGEGPAPNTRQSCLPSSPFPLARLQTALTDWGERKAPLTDATV